MATRGAIKPGRPYVDSPVLIIFVTRCSSRPVAHQPGGPDGIIWANEVEDTAVRRDRDDAGGT